MVLFILKLPKRHEQNYIYIKFKEAMFTTRCCMAFKIQDCKNDLARIE